MKSVNSLSSGMQFNIKHIRSRLCTTSISVPSHTVDKIYKETLYSQQKEVSTHGFSKGTVPIEYIQQNFRSNITKNVAEFLYNYSVTSFLYKNIRDNKLPITGDPRLIKTHVALHEPAIFTFECTLFEPLHFKEWRHFPFKAPKRKNYKDLDKQVENFIQEEQSNLKSCSLEEIKIYDWVKFDVELVQSGYS